MVIYLMYFTTVILGFGDKEGAIGIMGRKINNYIVFSITNIIFKAVTYMVEVKK